MLMHSAVQISRMSGLLLASLCLNQRKVKMRSAMARGSPTSSSSAPSRVLALLQEEERNDRKEHEAFKD